MSAQERPRFLFSDATQHALVKRLDVSEKGIRRGRRVGRRVLFRDLCLSAPAEDRQVLAVDE